MSHAVPIYRIFMSGDDTRRETEGPMHTIITVTTSTTQNRIPNMNTMSPRVSASTFRFASSATEV